MQSALEFGSGHESSDPITYLNYSCDAIATYCDFDITVDDTEGASIEKWQRNIWILLISSNALELESPRRRFKSTYPWTHSSLCIRNKILQMVYSFDAFSRLCDFDIELERRFAHHKKHIYIGAILYNYSVFNRAYLLSVVRTAMSICTYMWLKLAFIVLVGTIIRYSKIITLILKIWKVVNLCVCYFIHAETAGSILIKFVIEVGTCHVGLTDPDSVPYFLTKGKPAHS